MAGSGAYREIEIKLRLRDAEQGRRLLQSAGFRIGRPRVFEADTIFDTADGSLRSRGSLLRIRASASRALLTFKGPAGGGKHKSREETEVEVSGAGDMAEVLARLGFAPVFRYEKYRTEYVAPQEAGLALLDETPIGDFLELEGPPEWIDRTAARLGFAEPDYITASYASLYLEDCRARNIAPENMVFSAGEEPRQAPNH